MTARHGPALAVALLLGACNSDASRVPAPDPALEAPPAAAQSGQPVVVFGTVRDAETGEPIPRDRIYLHFFCDDVDHQTSLEFENVATYELELPRPEIRVRVFDAALRYLPLETTLVAELARQPFDLELRPSHYVQVHLQCIDAQTGEALRPSGGSGGFGGGPRVYLRSGERPLPKGSRVPGDDGRITLRLPRDRVTIKAVNTSRRLLTEEIDLSDVEADGTTVEVRFE